MNDYEIRSVVNQSVSAEELSTSLWQKHRCALKEYSSFVFSRYAGEHARAVVREAGRFLLFLQLDGLESTKDVGYPQVLRFNSCVECRTEKSRDARIGRFRVFLKYLVEAEGLPVYLVFLTDKFAIAKLVLLDSLPVDERTAFLQAQGGEVGQGMPDDQYFAAYNALSKDCLPLHGYSKTMLKAFRLAWRDLYIFLCANKLRYSLPLADRWVGLVIKGTGNTGWKTYRRAFRLLEQFVAAGDIDPGIVYTYKPDSASKLPSWSRTLLLDYLELRKTEGQAESSVAMQKSSCIRFLLYLDRVGITACSMVTPQVLKGFHASDRHETVEGKNAYNVRVRQFIDHLADLGLVAPTLRLAIPTSSAKATRLVETLTDEECETIGQNKTSASTPRELRDIAMVMLGLRMGLRPTDVVSIRLKDVSWADRTISVVQQKTGHPIVLPMPLEVANCLFRYIMHGRPKTSSEHLFVAKRVPFGKLHRAACRRALNNTLDNHQKRYGFHITRRTFASRMLGNDVPFDTISDALGHRQRETVFEYLATDEEGLRGCAIPLSAIPLSEGALKW